MNTLTHLISILLIWLSTFLIADANPPAEKILKTAQPVYCAEAGGYPKDQRFKFPIETREKARAALAYAFWAPNPDGIRTCVCNYYGDFPSCRKLKK